MVCRGEHTVPDVPSEDWCCPNCGTTDSGTNFYVEEVPSDANSDCPRLHVHDSVVCRKCNKYWTGDEIAVIHAEKKGIEKCCSCNGTGVRVSRTGA